MLFQHWEEAWAAANLPAAYVDVLRTTARPKLYQPSVAFPAAASLISLPAVCCAAAGGTWQAADVVTHAWDLLYTALHVLDSVEDADTSDEPWAQVGTGAAINVSTGLIAGTGAMLCNLEQHGIAPDAAQAIRQEFFQTLLHMTGGQHADLTLAQPTLAQCWQIAAAKSGAWFALACCVGARVATDDVSQLEWFRQVGYHLGMLIQIGDDLDGLWSTSGTCSDLVNWPRWTLPVAYATMVLDAEERAQLHTCLCAAATDSVAEDEARRIIIKAGAVLYLVIEARQQYEAAHCALLHAAPPSTARDALLTLLRAYVPQHKQ
jgi:geranylgeranyl diphosphate synthase type I